MAKLNLHLQSDSERHNCESHRNGDWIIYTCPKCDYELRENWRTGKLQISNPKINIRHSGNYFPYEYKEAFENQN